MLPQGRQNKLASTVSKGTISTSLISLKDLLLPPPPPDASSHPSSPSPAELSYFINIPVQLFAPVISCVKAPRLASAASSQIYTKTAEFCGRVAQGGFPVSCFITPFPHFKILIFSVDPDRPLWSFTAWTSETRQLQIWNKFSFSYVAFLSQEPTFSLVCRVHAPFQCSELDDLMLLNIAL